MFNKILLPIQDEASGRPVFDKALALAKQDKAGLMLLHALSPEARTTPNLPNPVLYQYPIVTDELMRTYQKRWQEVESQGLEMLKRFAEEAESVSVSAEFSQNIGRAERVICAIAKNWQADLIVIRQPIHGKLDELFVGSVSNYVLHHAPCSVLTVVV